MAQRKTALRLRMGKAGRIEIKPQILFLCPTRPGFKVPGFDPVSVDWFFSKIAVHRVQVDAVTAGNKRKNLFQIALKLRDRSGFAGIISGDCQTSAVKRRPGRLESAHIVTLPTMNRQRDPAQRLWSLANLSGHANRSQPAPTGHGLH